MTAAAGDELGDGLRAGAEAAERVRACTACGDIVAYHLRTCPQCGQHDAYDPSTTHSAERRACDGCGESLAVERIFCPQCGKERGRHREPRPLTTVDESRSARPLIVLGVVLTLLGPIVLLAAVLLTYWL